MTELNGNSLYVSEMDQDFKREKSEEKEKIKTKRK